MTFTQKEQEQLLAIQTYVEKQFASDKTGHDFFHIERVVKNAKKINHNEDGESFLVIASAYLHESLDDKFFPNSEKAERELRNFLTSIEIQTDMVDRLLEAIANVSFSKSLEQETAISLEAQIVQDADRLDAIGAIGIARTFYYGGSRGSLIYDPAIPPRTKLTKKEYREENTVINHFYEKLLLLSEKMNTETGKLLAKKRHQFMLDYLQEFYNEWNL